MTSWLPGGLKSSLTNFKDQVTNSIKDALEELDEEETGNFRFHEKKIIREIKKLVIIIINFRY